MHIFHHIHYNLHMMSANQCIIDDVSHFDFIIPTVFSIFKIFEMPCSLSSWKLKLTKNRKQFIRKLPSPPHPLRQKKWQVFVFYKIFMRWKFDCAWFFRGIWNIPCESLIHRCPMLLADMYIQSHRINIRQSFYFN